MRLPRKHLITLAALFALLGAQVFGLQRGYVCDCSGEAVQTMASACADGADGCGHDHEGQPQEHAPLKVKHEAQGKPASAPQVQAPVLVAIVNFVQATTLAISQSQALVSVKQAPPDWGAGPPAALLVAECKVLLV